LKELSGLTGDISIGGFDAGGGVWVVAAEAILAGAGRAMETLGN